MVVIQYPHLFVRAAPKSSAFTSHLTARDNITFPDRTDRRGHAQFVRTALDNIWEASKNRIEHRKTASLITRTGTYIEFQSAPGFDLKTKSLDLGGSGIRLLNVVTKKDQAGNETIYATVFVPAGKEGVVVKKIDEYEKENTTSGKPKNEPLVAGIQRLKEAVLDSFWRDIKELPQTGEWCEAWLRCGDNPEATVTDFTDTCKACEINFKVGFLVFPERLVVLINASSNQLKELLFASDDIAEFRKAKTTASFWTELTNADQSGWTRNLADRLVATNEPTVSACVIDTGANNGHLLLQPMLKDSDCHTLDPDWGIEDTNGHGSLMCGIAAYGNALETLLQTDSAVEVSHCLESIKLIPESGNYHEPALYGLRTKQALSRVEIQRKDISRAVCLAITSDDHHDEGRPTSWSGSVDQLCAGAEDDTQRLIVVSAGNVVDPNAWKDYPDTNITLAVQDPGQAWNAVTVGAVTHKTTILDPLYEQYSPVASEGQLSPFSTTSYLWDNKWPNKPDVVFEGGNLGIDSAGFTTECDDLSVLSTNHQPLTAQFASMNMTSAATAQASYFAAKIWAAYPNAWPETIRALMIHSASWSDEIAAQFCSKDRTEKENYDTLLRAVGYGEPDAKKAIESANNSLTLIVEQEIQPFKKKVESSGNQTNEMHLIDLPWPKDALNDLPGETEVRINITLSYFVEPGPGEIGWRDKYRYRSHGLSFDLIGPQEKPDEFLKKLNKAALEGDEKQGGGSAIDWTIGRNARSRGSIHRDWWTTTAADAAQCNVIGIYPQSGWWKERKHLNKGASNARYTLLVSVETPTVEVGIDIHTPVATLIKTPIEITT